MLALILPYVVPFGATIAFAGLLRVVGGSERGGRTAGVSIVGGFLLGWYWTIGPTWWPVDALTRVPHIALGGAMLGLILDAFQPSRKWVAACVIIFGIACGWMSVQGELVFIPPREIESYAVFALIFVVWVLVLTRLGNPASNSSGTLVNLIVSVVGIACIAGLYQNTYLMHAGTIFLTSLLGYLILVWTIGLSCGYAVVFGAGGLVLALAVALVQSHPETWLAVAMLLLVLFADRTARRVLRGPDWLLSFAYPTILFLVSCLPVMFAVALAYLALK